MVAGWNETTPLLPNKQPNLLSNHNLQYIYNVDEFELFYQCLPDKSYHLKTEKCSGGDTTKSRSLVWQLPMPLVTTCLCLLLIKQKI